MRYRFSDLVLDTGRRQLSRDGTDIKLTKLSFEVLRVLVEAAPNLVDHDELVDRAWGENRVVTPENVAQRVLMLRQSLGDSASEPRYIENVRGQGLRLIPEVAPLDAPGPSPAPARSPWLALGVVALAAAVVFMATRPNDEGPAISTQPEAVTEGRQVMGDGPTVGVLPFANLSPDPDNAFFAAGLHEEVLNQLASLKGFGVISRTSMMRYADSSQSIPEIARELKVQHLIEGSVRTADNRIRVTIQLLDGASDTHLWSETYDRELQDIFEIESDIARNVASVLQHTLSEAESTLLNRAPTSNLEAYTEYVLGNEAMSRRSASGLEQALDHFKRATALDANYLEAWIGLATTHYLAVEYTGSDLQQQLAAVETALSRAEAIDADHALVWLMRAQASQWRRENAVAEQQFQRALALNPGHARTWHSYAHFALLHSLDIEAGLEAMEVALALDPRAPELQAMYTAALARIGEPEKALRSMRVAVARDPEFPILYASMGWRLSAAGQLGEALHWIRRGLALPEPYPSLHGMQCTGLRRLGMTEEATTCRAALPRSDAPALNADMDLETIARAAPLHPEGWDRWIVMQMLAGDNALAMMMLQAVVPQYLGDDDVELNPSMAPTAALAGVMLRGAGNIERGDYLLDQSLVILQDMARKRQGGLELWEVVIHVHRQDTENALRALREAIDRGWRAEYQVLHSPFFRPMMQVPEWAAMVEEVESDIARQRALYLQFKDEPEWPLQ